MQKLNVPCYSQYVDVHDTSVITQSEAWAVTCLAMVLAYYDEVLIATVDDLIKEGIAIKGFEKRGWVHSKLVALARNHGVSAYNQEFKSIRVNVLDTLFKESSFARRIRDKGIEKMKFALENHDPVMVSVVLSDGSYHVILLVGFDDECFIYHEPSAKSCGEGMYQHMPFEDFTCLAVFGHLF